MATLSGDTHLALEDGYFVQLFPQFRERQLLPEHVTTVLHACLQHLEGKSVSIANTSFVNELTVEDTVKYTHTFVFVGSHE